MKLQVFKISKEFRKYGINAGRPSFRVGMGFGLSLNTDELIEKLTTLGVRPKSLVSIYGDPIGERGIKDFISALNYLKVDIDIECTGKSKDPGWFTQVGSWNVIWDPNGQFNYGALRPKQDLLICPSKDLLQQFLEQTDKLYFNRGVFVTDDSEALLLLEPLLPTNLRVLVRQSED